MGVNESHVQPDSGHCTSEKVKWEKMFVDYKAATRSPFFADGHQELHLIIWSFFPKAFYGKPAPDLIQRLAIKGFGGWKLKTMGLHFKVLDDGALVAALESTGIFFPFQ